MESRTSPGKRGSMQPISVSPEACVCHSFLGCTSVAAAEGDIPFAEDERSPVLFSLACPRFLRPRQESVCLGFLSLASPQALCRCTSGLTDVAGLSPCPICLPVSPSQSYFGVGARCGEADASECCAIPSPHGRTHQEGFPCQRVALVEVLLPSSAFPSFCRFAKCSCDERPDGSLLAFASRDVAPRIHPVTGWLLLSPSSCTRLPIRLLCK
jgi:hypothetical protein